MGLSKSANFLDILALLSNLSLPPQLTRSFSTSSLAGIDGAVPGRVTEIDAVAHPNLTASNADFPSDNATAKPPLNVALLSRYQKENPH